MCKRFVNFVSCNKNRFNFLQAIYSLNLEHISKKLNYTKLINIYPIQSKFLLFAYQKDFSTLATFKYTLHIYITRFYNSWLKMTLAICIARVTWLNA